MGNIPLTVLEGDDPFFTASAVKRLPDGSIVAMDLTGGTVKWLVKLSPDIDDAFAIASYDAVILAPPTDGRYTVQLTNTVTSTPGTFWYAITWHAGGKQQTMQYGDWHVVNT